ncbi:MAG: ABC transporter ATP-binding protein [Clostridia bacterium]|nr:ABC transporter ATP-binding protein [Clostridia bacterium]
MSKIKVENIVKTFNRHSRNANKVLKGVSFELPEKGLTCIFGKSGSGKTTLLNIIGGLEKADSGKVYIDGECTSGKTDKIRNAKIGFIFQNYYLEKGYTIAEILRNQMIIAGFKDEKEIARRTEEALKLVDMERFKNKLGDALSGGQQQRVAIARAIVKGSDVILADEPTGNLDAENTMKVMDILKEISKTQLVVIVTHEVSLIKKYADSHIKIVDGELVEDGEIEETDLAPATYDNIKEGNETHSVLTTFTKSTAKRNGRLFTLKTIFKRNNAGGEKAYSVGNVFKQIFILALAVVMTFFSFSAFEALSAVTENKTLGKNTVYTNLNSYSVLRKTDESHYKSIDFFDTEMRTGSFSYGGLASLSGIEVKYTPKAIEEGDEIAVEYGRLPQKGEAIVSRKMAEELKREFRMKELNTDKAITLMTFDGEYPITGITGGDDKIIYLNKEDYVNFLGVYNKIGFSDGEEIFFKDTYGSASFTAEILLYDGEIANDKVRVEINRNSLYKMMTDTTQADFEVNKTNSRLKNTPYAIQVTGSKVYVEQFVVTRDVMDTDIRVYVNKNVLHNIFVYISPNLDALSSTGSQYYFEITTESPEQLASLKSDLRDLGVTAVNVGAAYEQENEEEKQDAASGLYLYLLVIVLLLIIYFFIEKSASIKNSKEYGIYRAIGVNKGNLLFKECVTAVVHNVFSFFVFSAITVALVAVRYAIMNVAFAGFIGLAAASFAVGAAAMTCISLIPYLFVLTQSPSEILARYDI